MAMTKCRECGHQISTKAEACPSCGAKQAKSSGCLKFLLIPLALLVVLSLFVRLNGAGTDSIKTVDASGRVQQQAEPKSVAPIRSSDQMPEQPGSQWEYSQGADSMGKAAIRQAQVLSSNVVEFDFPYAGAQHATISLRSHPRHGKDVIFSIERGQIQCPSYDDCTVVVRFDDETAANYPAVGAEDNSGETIFIRNYARFVEKVAKAKRVRISVPVFQQGAPVFEFDVSNFDQRKYRGEPPVPSPSAR